MKKNENGSCRGSITILFLWVYLERKENEQMENVKIVFNYPFNYKHVVKSCMGSAAHN